MEISQISVVLVGIIAVAVGGNSCPDNSMAVDTLLEECKDLSDRCSACANKCTAKNHNQWMEANCAKTCRICDSQVIPQSTKKCWSYNKGYPDDSALETASFSSYNDCKYRCLTNSGCVGVHITDYSASGISCVLAKNGSLTGRTKYFGATRECLEQNPSEECDDHWSTCYSWRSICHSCRWTTKSMMLNTCQQTCRTCGANQYSWTKIEGNKVKGAALMSSLTLDRAEGECEAMGDMCTGVFCRGNTACKVMADISQKKLKKKTKFDTYKKVHYLGLENLGCWTETNYPAIPTLLLNNPDGDLLEKCKSATIARGWTVFAVRYNRRCFSGAGAANDYDKHGCRSKYYEDRWCGPEDSASYYSNQVYRIRDSE